MDPESKEDAMKVIPAATAPGPPEGGVQDVDMPETLSESDSEDELPLERSEEIQEFEKVVAERAEQFGVLGENVV
eukprot:12643614-Alexandrium_andersonii.AAC.1